MSKWLTGGRKCTQYRFIWYTQHRYRHRNRQYRFTYMVDAIQSIQGAVGDSHGVPPPHCRHQLPKHSICPARPPPSLWHQYGDNYYPTPVAVNLSPHSPDPCLGHLFLAKSCSLIIYFSSSSQHSSSSLVRGFRVGPTPVIRKIVGEEKEGI